MNQISWDNLPQSLKERGAFCLHKNKTPYQVNGWKADPTNRNHYADFTTVKETYELGGYDGIGIGMFDGLCGVDIDHCVSGDEITDLAKAVIDRVSSYTEYSPSGAGVHILSWCDNLNYTGRKKKNRNLGLEVYDKDRYLTLTLNRVPQSCADVQLRTEEVQTILDQYMVAEHSGGTAPRKLERRSPQLSDSRVLDLLGHARNADRFKALYYDGDLSMHDNDHSGADLALCGMIAFYTQDEEQIDRLFRGSALMRSKWDERHGAQDYSTMTIDKALSTLKNVYDPAGLAFSHIWGEEGNPLDQWGESLEPDDLSDAGNAELFSRIYYGNLAFTSSLGWLHWDGRKWKIDDTAADRAAQDFTKAMLREATARNLDAGKAEGAAAALVENADDEQRPEAEAARDQALTEKRKAKVFLNWAKKSRDAGKHAAIVKLSKSYLQMEAGRFDATPHHLNTPLGVVDLTTGELISESKAAMCTKSTAVAPGTDGMDEWEKLLDTVFCGNRDYVRWMQEVLGMALHGKVYEEKLFFAYGGGRNGKSTFFNAIADVLGDYAVTLAADTITKSREGKLSNSLSCLRGARLAILPELEQGRRAATSVIKTLASTDKITVERKYHDSENVHPSHTAFLCTNFLPTVDATDNGTWRRICTIPFNAVIDAADQISNYGSLLYEQCGGAILSWCIEGAVRFAANGYILRSSPLIVEAATEDYRRDEDSVAQFLKDKTEASAGGSVPASYLYNAYSGYCAAEGFAAKDVRSFKKVMLTKGFESRKRKTGMCWLNLKMTTTDILTTTQGGAAQ